ncbi:unnamed protein product [Thlaspi arvense]|uniref:Uncharacterized protein n=1 Tax=Thlaspi arvense TaxID=13288 RepID=A0AAU9SGJ2_THLAR|nr:unnamed protein product [Thlaspi arvense]
MNQSKDSQEEISSVAYFFNRYVLQKLFISSLTPRISSVLVISIISSFVLFGACSNASETVETAV